MTRTEFVERYMRDRDSIPASHRIPFWFAEPEPDNYTVTYVECQCGERGCPGWAMISAGHGVLEGS